MHIIFIIQENIPVGGFCSHDTQCTGSEHAELCQNSKCRCSNGYILIDSECKRGLFFNILETYLILCWKALSNWTTFVGNR